MYENSIALFSLQILRWERFAVPDEGSPNRTTSRPAAAAMLGAATPGRGRIRVGLGKRRPKGPTPRHNALRPMPLTMPRHAASQPVMSKNSIALSSLQFRR
jgi:hypothetical protein